VRGSALSTSSMRPAFDIDGGNANLSGVRSASPLAPCVAQGIAPTTGPVPQSGEQMRLGRGRRWHGGSVVPRDHASISSALMIAAPQIFLLSTRWSWRNGYVGDGSMPAAARRGWIWM
jgi:hypothetical protein